MKYKEGRDFVRFRLYDKNFRVCSNIIIVSFDFRGKGVDMGRKNVEVWFRLVCFV